MKVTFVLGTTAGGTLRHVQMLAAGCAERGVPTLVCGPAEHAQDFPRYQTVQFGDRPSVRDGRAVLQLRRTLSREQPDVVHAHGLRAGALAALALSLATRPSRAALPLVVTVHNAPPASGANTTVYQGLQFLVARSAAVVLCVSRDLEDRMRQAGARDVRRALVPSYDPGTRSDAPDSTPAADPEAVRAELGASGRPLILAAGRLASQKGFGPLIEAARGWQDLSPVPLLAIAGSGPLHSELVTA
ncbi:MAG TPA: glycosyltransferase, partial [Streptosporangiaceae bacterium]